MKISLSHSEDESRDIDKKIAKILGWTNIDWHFDRAEPMRMWLGGTPPGVDGETGWLEEIPEFSRGGDELITMLDWLAMRFISVDLYSDCGDWFCRVHDLSVNDEMEIIADSIYGYRTPSKAVRNTILRVAENERA